MTIKIIIEEYYNLICEMNYLLILSNGTLEDSENIQFIMEEVLINDDFKNQYIDYQFIDSKEEQRADNFAKNVLINQKDYDLFIENSELNITNIRNFALSQNVLPGIVIGRIENDRNDYSFMTQYREKYKWCNEPNDN